MNNDVGRGICLDQSQEMCSLYRGTWTAESCNQVTFAACFKRSCAVSYSVEGKRICLDNSDVREEGVEVTSPA
jgi:hypothetical protein